VVARVHTCCYRVPPLAVTDDVTRVHTCCYRVPPLAVTDDVTRVHTCYRVPPLASAEAQCWRWCQAAVGVLLDGGDDWH
jgi:hypothetical protein